MQRLKQSAQSIAISRGGMEHHPRGPAEQALRRELGHNSVHLGGCMETLALHTRRARNLLGQDTQVLIMLALLDGPLSRARLIETMTHRTGPGSSVSDATIGQHLVRLAARGLVRQTITDHGDERYELTDEGYRRSRWIRRIVRAAQPDVP